jgi:hypothetical protein
MPSRRLRGLVPIAALALAGVLAAGMATSAWAHPRPVPAVEAPPPIEAPSAIALDARPPSSGALGLVLIVVLGMALVRPRRTVRVALAVLLAVLAVEAGVHSVHHLRDHQAAEECATASVSGHLHGAEQSGTPDGACVTAVVAMVPAAAPDRPARRPFRPDEGRAPPA